MGGCVSSPKTKTSKGSMGGQGKQVQADCNKQEDELSSTKTKTNKTTKVIHMDIDGWVQELKQPTQAKAITSQNPNCFLCSSESLSIGTCAPHVPDDEDLQPGHIYFLMPLSRAHQPLSLPDLCTFAIKASSALRANGVDLWLFLNQLLLIIRTSFFFFWSGLELHFPRKFNQVLQIKALLFCIFNCQYECGIAKVGLESQRTNLITSLSPKKFLLVHRNVREV